MGRSPLLSRVASSELMLPTNRSPHYPRTPVEYRQRRFTATTGNLTIRTCTRISVVQYRGILSSSDRQTHEANCRILHFALTSNRVQSKRRIFHLIWVSYQTIMASLDYGTRWTSQRGSRPVRIANCSGYKGKFPTVSLCFKVSELTNRQLILVTTCATRQNSAM
jgi:hypothetical protein